MSVYNQTGKYTPLTYNFIEFVFHSNGINQLYFNNDIILLRDAKRLMVKHNFCVQSQVENSTEFLLACMMCFLEVDHKTKVSAR